MTPWEKMAKRLELAAEADFVICLYNLLQEARRLPAAGVRHPAAPQAGLDGMRHGAQHWPRGGRIARAHLGRTAQHERRHVHDRLHRKRADDAVRWLHGHAARLPAARRAGVKPAQPHILVFGGTVEGRELVEWLAARASCLVTSCTATPYGASLVAGGPQVTSSFEPLPPARIAQLMDKTFVRVRGRRDAPLRDPHLEKHPRRRADAGRARAAARARGGGCGALARGGRARSRRLPTSRHTRERRCSPRAAKISPPSCKA